MHVQSPELYIARNVIEIETPAVSEGVIPELRERFKNDAFEKLHISILSQKQTQRITRKYPSDNPQQLLETALDELQLPDRLIPHIDKPSIAGGGDTHYLAFPLDEEGVKRIREDIMKIFGYFGIQSTNKGQPHLSLIRAGKNLRYAHHLKTKAEQGWQGKKPIVLGAAEVKRGGRRR